MKGCCDERYHGGNANDRGYGDSCRMGAVKYINDKNAQQQRGVKYRGADHESDSSQPNGDTSISDP